MSAKLFVSGNIVDVVNERIFQGTIEIEEGKIISIKEEYVENTQFIIPGLIANWMERQGVLKTVLALVLTASAVRLLLIVVTGGQILGNV